MKMPSDKEWERQIEECDKAFHKALAMPRKTSVEGLIQGAKLVNAIGRTRLFCCGM